uniref:Uncharacterized protein n=1 Tax=Pristionchus pacificus TaxID=54126 RepID=A0A2A6BUD1_PRIPA|eukprot:PDM69582.1 hypothetical protein PRIPAC_44678 [Pristionchus pacificus]
MIGRPPAELGAPEEREVIASDNGSKCAHQAWAPADKAITASMKKANAECLQLWQSYLNPKWNPPLRASHPSRRFDPDHRSHDRQEEETDDNDCKKRKAGSGTASSRLDSRSLREEYLQPSSPELEYGRRRDTVSIESIHEEANCTDESEQEQIREDRLTFQTTVIPPVHPVTHLIQEFRILLLGELNELLHAALALDRVLRDVEREGVPGKVGDLIRRQVDRFQMRQLTIAGIEERRKTIRLQNFDL